jgi:hypothetical protein
MVKWLIQKVKNTILANKKKNLNPRLKKPVYFGRHLGSDVLIIATGPSLRKYGELVKRFVDERMNSLITIGVNHLNGLLVPDYQMFTNRKKFCTHMKYVSHEPVMLLAPTITKWVINKIMQDRYYEVVMFREEIQAKMWSSLDQHNMKEGDIRLDSNGIIYLRGSTVATQALGVAMAMGAKNIYFAGLDGFSIYDPGKIHHFEVDDIIPFERRIAQEKFTADILDAAADILSRTNARLRIITPTVYSKHFELLLEQ